MRRSKQTRAYSLAAHFDYGLAKPYLSEKPLRRPPRTQLGSALPTYGRLRELAKRHRPPQEWYDGAKLAGTIAAACLALMPLAGCGTQTILVPPGTVGRLAEPASVRIYTWDGTQWVESGNKATIPAGWYFGPPPPGATTLP